MNQNHVLYFIFGMVIRLHANIGQHCALGILRRHILERVPLLTRSAECNIHLYQQIFLLSLRTLRHLKFLSYMALRFCLRARFWRIVFLKPINFYRDFYYFLENSLRVRTKTSKKKFQKGDFEI